MGGLAIFFLREALHEVELSSAFRNGLQQLETPLHSVSPLQQLFSQFYGSFNKDSCPHFSFFVPRQVAEKFAQCNRALSSEEKVAFKFTKTSRTVGAVFNFIRQAVKTVSGNVQKGPRTSGSNKVQFIGRP